MASERPKWWICAGEQVDFKTASLHVRRAKNGTPATHPLTGRELRALRKHQREGLKCKSACKKDPLLEWAPRAGQISSCRFDRRPGVLILELLRAQIAEG